MAREDPVIRYETIVYHPDSKTYLSLEVARLWREYANWLDSVNLLMIEAQGEIELPSGIVKWRRLP